MSTLTLIPNSNTYGVVVLTLLSLGSFNIARHIHLRWLKNKFSFVGSNAVVKVSIALLGLIIIPLTSLFSPDVYREIYSLILGVFFGFLTIFLEVSMVRKLNRKKLVYKNNRTPQQDSTSMRNVIINQKMALSSSQQISAKGISDIRKSYTHYIENPHFVNYSLFAVLIVAISEEFLFRGYLIIIANSINSYLMAAGIILLSLFAFSFSHLSTSWREFTCKLPLSLFTTAIFIATGSLIGAIVIHLLLNTYAYLNTKNIIRFKRQNNVPLQVIS
jgi:hypothetical protein